MPSEFELIDWIRSQTAATPRLVVPLGDDLAALKWDASELLIVGADQVLDGVHFDSAIHSPDAIGRKGMNRNLSDCAAMAAKPVAAVVTVALPRERDLDYAKKLYLGLKSAGDAFDCDIVGGDTATWPGPLALSVSIIAAASPAQLRRRSGARVGDTIFVTGPLGGSILGRHMTFTPRVAEGLRIGAMPETSAMIDLSDGLSRDLAHVCRESGVGAIVRAECVPIHPDAERMADGRAALEHALHDGEDYELLFTSSLKEIDGCTAIGEIVAGGEIMLQTGDHIASLQASGWQHRIGGKSK